MKSHPSGGRVSEQGQHVLEALVTADEPLPVAAVLVHVRRPDASAPVARASLSRTLRRLWAAGLVELVTGHATRPTLTEQAKYWRSVYAKVQAAPDAAYQAYRRLLANPADDDYGSAAAYVDACRVDAERPSARVRRVALTPKGRERLTSKSVRSRTVTSNSSPIRALELGARANGWLKDRRDLRVSDETLALLDRRKLRNRGEQR